MRARLVSFVLVMSVACVVGAARGDLRLVNNGYEGLVVTITDHVPQQHCNHVVQGLKVRRFVPLPLSLPVSSGPTGVIHSLAVRSASSPRLTDRNIISP